MATAIYQYHRQRHCTPIRNYEPGEDMSGIYVADGVTPAEGDKIAISTTDASAKWLITAKDYRTQWILVQRVGDYIEHLADKPKPTKRRRSKAATADKEV